MNTVRTNSQWKIETFLLTVTLIHNINLEPKAYEFSADL